MSPRRRRESTTTIIPRSTLTAKQKAHRALSLPSESTPLRSSRARVVSLDQLLSTTEAHYATGLDQLYNNHDTNLSCSLEASMSSNKLVSLIRDREQRPYLMRCYVQHLVVRLTERSKKGRAPTQPPKVLKSFEIPDSTVTTSVRFLLETYSIELWRKDHKTQEHKIWTFVLTSRSNQVESTKDMWQYLIERAFKVRSPSIFRHMAEATDRT